MKTIKLKILTVILLLSGFVLITAFISTDQYLPQDDTASAFVIPEEVNEILQNKCFDCHNIEAEGEKAKEKLLLDELADLKKSKQISKLDAIAEVCENKDMPPEKFIAKYPEQALTDDEAKLILDWANKTADELLK